MNNSVYTKNLWCFDIPGVLYLNWNTLPFEIKNRIEWRGIAFHVQINAHKIQYGSTRVISFIYDNKQYDCKLTKWKYTGGGNGIYPPEIFTKEYFLKIETTLNSLLFTDTPLIKEKAALPKPNLFLVTDSLKQFAKSDK